MYFALQYDVGAVIEPKGDRWALKHAYIEKSAVKADEGTLIATDGFVLVAVPVKLDSSDVIGNGLLQVDVLDRAIKLAKKAKDLLAFVGLDSEEEARLSDRSVLPRILPLEEGQQSGPFPAWKRIIPTAEQLTTDPAADWTINIPELKKFEKALGAKKLRIKRYSSGKQTLYVVQSTTEEHTWLTAPFGMYIDHS